RLFEHQLHAVGERLQQTPWADNVRTSPDLHRRQHLALRISEVGNTEKQEENPKDDKDHLENDGVAPEGQECIPGTSHESPSSPEVRAGRFPCTGPWFRKPC